MNGKQIISRRTMIKGAAAAVAAPYIVPASAMGRGGWLPPSERLNVGFVGVGNMGSAHHGGFLRDNNFNLIAICDIDGVKCEAKAKATEEHYASSREKGSYKGCTQYHYYEELLARDDLDAVLIAVPDHWHAIIAISACKAGKDVYCEKPLSLTIREAQAMEAAARRYGRVFQTGSQQRSDANFHHACELVRNGRIGQLKTVHVNIGQPSSEKYFPVEPVRARFDWERWQGQAAWHEYNSERCSGNYGGGWRMVRDYSGGMTTDWGAHHFDIAQWGMGRDGSGPIEVIPPSLSETGNLTMKYDDGVELYRAGDAPDHGHVNGVLFTGTEGKVEVNRGYIKTWPDSVIHETLGAGDTPLYKSPGHREDWFECIKTRRRPICDVAVGASSVTVCHLANIACWTNHAFKWCPETREILNDDSAARWLDRPKRTPYRLPV